MLNGLISIITNNWYSISVTSFSFFLASFMQGHLRHNWRTRWFELTKQGLRYYRKKEDKSPAGTISLAGGTLAYPSLDDHKKPVI